MRLTTRMVRNSSVPAIAFFWCAIVCTIQFAAQGTNHASKGLVSPTPGFELLFQLPLIAEAEQNRYTLRRIEFVGNEHIRDQVLRQRTRSLREGNIFKRAALKQSLTSLNRLRILPVAIKDVEVRLDRKDKAIDLVIPVKERPGTR